MKTILCITNTKEIEMAKKKVKEVSPVVTLVETTKLIITNEDIKFKIIWSANVCEMQNFIYKSVVKKDIYASLRKDETIGLGFDDNTNSEFDKDIILYTYTTNWEEFIKENSTILEEFIKERNIDITSKFAIYLTYQDYLDNKAAYVKGK
jgi:hypothetical protein